MTVAEPTRKDSIMSPVVRPATADPTTNPATEPTTNPVTEPTTVEASRPGDPWILVLVLGVVLAYGDDFVLTSVREAVGAIANTQSPFRRWLVESTTLSPAFVVAVLGAVMLARRRLGSIAHRPGAVLGSALLIVASATVAGTTVAVAHAVADYGLQTGQLAQMHMGAPAASPGTCAGTCLALRQAILDLQVHAVGVGVLLLLAANLALVATVVGLAGDRVTLAVPRTVRRREAPSRGLHLLAAAGLTGSALIHIAVVPQHLQEWPLAGAFFVVLAACQLAGAVGLVARPSVPARVAGGVLALGLILLWTLSRTIGLPVVPDAGAATEPVGVADLTTFMLEVATLASVIMAGRRPTRLRSTRAASAHVASLLGSSVVALTVIGVASGLGAIG